MLFKNKITNNKGYELAEMLRKLKSPRNLMERLQLVVQRTMDTSGEIFK